MIGSETRFRLRSLTHLLIPAVALALLAAPLPAQAQQEEDEEAQEEPEQVFAQVTYMGVDQGEAASEYVSLEEEIWNPIHQEMADDGSILDWNLYAVTYPEGTGHDYNYVTITFYESLDDVENTDYETYAERAHPDSDVSELFQQTFDARDVVRTELWERLDEVSSDTPASEPPAFLQVDHMKVDYGEISDYVSFEEEIWKPVHEARVEAGTIGSWGLWQMALPGGTSQPYNFATVATLESMADVADPYPEGVWEEVHPDRSMDEIAEQTLEARDLVQTELWQLVDAVSGGGADDE